MHTTVPTAHFSAPTTALSASTGARWTGRVLSALGLLFLTFDTVIKLLELPPAIEATTQLGYSAGAVFTIGIIELLCVAAYAIPRTSLLGALLLTGYLGGAIATHLRAGSPLFSHTLFPVYVALFVWGGLFLRDAQLRAFLLRTRD